MPDAGRGRARVRHIEVAKRTAGWRTGLRRCYLQRGFLQRCFLRLSFEIGLGRGFAGASRNRQCRGDGQRGIHGHVHEQRPVAVEQIEQPRR